MICNKEFKNRDEQEKEACTRCDYTADYRWYDQLVNETNDIYLGIASTVKMFEKMARHGSERSHILILDDSDINSFFVDIQRLFNMTFPKGRGNFGNTDLCNFQMSPAMIKNLEPATEIYRHIINGTKIRFQI